MTEADILQDIVKVYRFIENQNKQTNALYELVKIEKIPHFF